MEVDESRDEEHTKVRPRKKNLYQQIRKQMEFYFGDVNLGKDRFLNQLIQEDRLVPIEVFLRFNRIKSLTTDPEDIANALRKSEMLKVTKDGLKVYRTTPISKKENEEDCTIYVEQLPQDANHDWILNVFGNYGTVDYVSIPKYKHKQAIKGFAFVEFSNPEEAQKALEAFGSVGCCLPSQMLPDELQSIATFDAESNTIVKGKLVKADVQQKHKEQPTASGSIEESGQPHCEEGTEETESKEKKKKRKRALEVEVECTEVELEQKEKKKRKKDELTNTSLHDEPETMVAAEAESGDGEPAMAISGEVSEGGEESGSKKKKKRKRNHKRKSQKKESPTSLGLRIMSKMEWRRLRAKYLNLQKEKMGAVKKRLRKSWGSNYQSPATGEYGMQEALKKKAKSSLDFTAGIVLNVELPEPVIDAKQFQNSGCVKSPATGESGMQEALKKKAKSSLDFTAGVILRVELPEPVIDVQQFQNKVKMHHDIAYVDVTDGSTEMHLRCISASAAQKLIAERPWKKLTLLEGEEEKDYWEKAIQNRNYTRDRTYDKGKKIKMRGRDKLLKRAESKLGKYIKFDDDDE